VFCGSVPLWTVEEVWWRMVDWWREARAVGAFLLWYRRAWVELALESRGTEFCGSTVDVARSCFSVRV